MILLFTVRKKQTTTKQLVGFPESVLASRNDQNLLSATATADRIKLRPRQIRDADERSCHDQFKNTDGVSSASIPYKTWPSTSIRTRLGRVLIRPTGLGSRLQKRIKTSRPEADVVPSKQSLRSVRLILRVFRLVAGVTCNT